jgi:LAO/AO transport system kinase
MNKSINPNIDKIIKHAKTKQYSAEEIANKIIEGDRNFLSKAISILESKKDSDNELADEIVNLCLPYAGNSWRIGITGVPGVGKSTFIDTFGEKLIEKGHKIAILAIDPSSSISGGSILGDKTRMEKLSGRTEAFIRPSPTEGTLGGVAAATRQTIILCEAAGFDRIIIETVGVGQSETAMASMVDVFITLTVAGTGDDLQGIKRGIMELTDFLIFTKDDGDNKKRIYVARKQFETALMMFPPKLSGWYPVVLSVSALENKGIDKVILKLDEFFDRIKQNKYFEINRKQQDIQWLNEQIIYLLKENFFSNDEIQNKIKLIQKQIINNEISPVTAAKLLIKTFFEIN